MTAGPTAAGRPLLWWHGARPRTLVAAVVPVLVGAAAAGGQARAARTFGCFVVALALQVGVNYANDYSDGRRGVDTAARVGPTRLTASGAVPAAAVARAAGAAFGVAAVVGLVLAWVAGWWLLLIGALAIAAAVLYSGGPRPYASAGLGELFVFVFFGLAATVGTAYVDAGRISSAAWWAAVPVGLLAVALLFANNLRDIATDTTAGKRTLAVRLGDARARAGYRLVVLAALCLPIVGWLAGGLPAFALLALLAAPLAPAPLRLVGSARGLELVQVLAGTAKLQLAFGVLFALGLWLA